MMRLTVSHVRIRQRRAVFSLRKTVVRGVTAHIAGASRARPDVSGLVSNDASYGLPCTDTAASRSFFLDKYNMFRFKVCRVNHYTNSAAPHKKLGRVAAICRKSVHQIGSRRGLTMIRVNRHVAAVLAANVLPTGVLSTTPARADDTTGQPAAESLAEVVVTAEKRETTESKTPIAMDVLSAKQIQEQGVHDLSTLSQVDPSLQFASTGIGAIFLTMRGVSSRDSTEIGDPAVPVGIDGFFQDRTYNVNEATYDLERIEVLRGPQGTLYGRNAIGGVVNFITQRPTQDYEGYASMDYGSYGTVNTQGAINIPMSDVVQVRASWGTFYHDGYRSEPLANAHYDDDDSKSARISVAFEPFDAFTADVYRQYLPSTSNCGGYEQL